MNGICFNYRTQKSKFVIAMTRAFDAQILVIKADLYNTAFYILHFDKESCC